MEGQKQQFDLANIMRCQPHVALEYISKSEAQGVRLSYTLTLRGEPNVSNTPFENNPIQPLTYDFICQAP